MFTDNKEITNIFKTGTVEIDVTECFVSPRHWNPGDCTKKVVNICNEGTKAIYVRVKFIPKWEGGLSTDNIHFEPTNCHWKKVGKWWYYKYILGGTCEMPCNPKCVTINLCVKISACSGNEYQGKMFSLYVKTEAIQCKNNQVICDWNLSPNDMFEIGFEECTEHDNECIKDPCNPCPTCPPKDCCDPCNESYLDLEYDNTCDQCHPCDPCEHRGNGKEEEFKTQK